jgi:hypothetical protein
MPFFLLPCGRFCGGLISIRVGHSPLKGFDALREPLTDFRQFTRYENNNDDDQDDNKMQWFKKS